MAKLPVRTVKSKEVPLHKEYLARWGGKINLDIGCGPEKKEGYIGVDIRKLPAVDVLHDLNDIPWPFEDNVADLIIASHVIEHVDDAISFMSELHRVIKVGGTVVIRYPHYSQRHTFRDPTHKRFMTLESLDYFICGAELFGDYSDFGFQLIAKILDVDNDIGWVLSRLNFEAYEKYWCKLFPACQVILELKRT